MHSVLVRRIVSRVPWTIAVSRFSAAEAVERYGAPAERVRVGTEGWQHLDRVKPDESILDRYGLRGKPFALAVSSPTLNKNFSAIAQAIRILGNSAPLCVVAGVANPSIFRAAGDGSDSIVRLGYVSDAALKALYQHASCFIFPSFYEGFGIPPLEAMSCGCPALASTALAVREVCGDVPLYFDPRHPEDLALRLREVFADPALRARMSSNGLSGPPLFMDGERTTESASDPRGLVQRLSDLRDTLGVNELRSLGASQLNCMLRRCGWCSFER